MFIVADLVSLNFETLFASSHFIAQIILPYVELVTNFEFF